VIKAPQTTQALKGRCVLNLNNNPSPLQGAPGNVHHKFEKQAFTAWELKRISYFYRVFIQSMIFSYQCNGFWVDQDDFFIGKNNL
jgi:hypothetical protein